MQRRTLKLAGAVASVVVFATAFSLPAAAHEHHARKKEHYAHRMHHGHYRHLAAADRPLTVRRRIPREPIMAPAPDPFSGPAAIVTGPVAIGATAVSLPFRAVGTIFPPQGNPAVNPLVLIGAPVHAIGQVVQLPFYAVDSLFGVPPTYIY